MHGRIILVKKRVFLRHLLLNMIILPRQARDEYRESTQKKTRFCRARPAEVMPCNEPQYDPDPTEGLAWCGKRVFCVLFIYNNDDFTKTGSVQT
eukprot:COSAG06_NODE_5025_length_3782_cov_10.424654_3_plen_94_part_00